MDKVIVLDFGSQYAHLIARRIRQLKVYSEIRQPSDALNDLEGVKGIVLSGGPSSVIDKGAPSMDHKVLELGIPVLGICYGHQLMSHLLGGKLEKGTAREYGFTKFRIGENPLFEGLGKEETVWMSHGDHVKVLPQGFEAVGWTDACVNSAVCNEEKKLFGLQFHPEVTHTGNGMKILDNFLKICGAEMSWSVESYLKKIEEDVKSKISGKKVFLLVSGGVDSTVAFVLLKKILGSDNVLGLHIDNGFMRLKESDHIAIFMEKLGLNVYKVDASKEFLKKLEKITDPEKKRKLIGKTFIDVANKIIRRLKLEDSLVGQGTIYPDTIESGDTKNSVKIKTHHNRVSIVKKMLAEGRMLEPLKDLYKDEVRALGKKLGMPSSMINRHPFPGPGLAIRCLCQEKPKKVSKKVEEKTRLVAESYDLDAKILPVRSVGVQGDNRSYKNPVMLIGKADWSLLNKAATEICNKFKEVNRVVWHVAGETDLKFRKSYLTNARLDLLRGIDFMVRKFVWEKNYHRRIWQMPVVLIPLGNRETIVLRPVCSTEVMTANFARMELDDVQKLAERIIETNKISAVLYDITNKPPGTVEWE